MEFHICISLSIFITTLSFTSDSEAHAMDPQNLPSHVYRRAGLDPPGSQPYFRGRDGKSIWKDLNPSRQRIKKPGFYKQNQLQDEVSTHKYLTSFALKRQMDRIALESESNITVEVLGKTVEYNDIVLLKIARKEDRFRANDVKYDEDVYKRVVFIVHGLDVGGLNNIHALTYIEDFKTLLSYYEAHLDKFDIFVIPVANPDGGASLELRHKNFSPQGLCSGVHVDRNFDIGWKNVDKNQCSSFYPGPSAFSEPESRAVKEVLHKYSNKIVGYLNVHASSDYPTIFKGEAVLYPKGYTDVQSYDDKYIDLRSEIDEALRNASFKTVTVDVEPLHSWYGKVAGTSVDYAAAVYGVPYALELCMQAYPASANKKIDYQEVSFVHVWSRVIDVIFNNIYKVVPKSSKK